MAEYKVGGRVICIDAEMTHVTEILANSKGLDEMRKHLCKSYLNLAKMAFAKKHKRFPTIEDAQEVYDLYNAQWRDSIIDKPLREKANREKGAEIWRFGCSYKIDVYWSLCRFLEFLYPVYRTRSDGSQYQSNCAADIMKERGIEFKETYIMDNNLFETYKSWVKDNLAKINKYHKPKYVDYSHLAYNGVTDDF